MSARAMAEDIADVLFVIHHENLPFHAAVPASRGEFQRQSRRPGRLSRCNRRMVAPALLDDAGS